MNAQDSVHLVPALFEKDGEEEFIQSGRTLSLACSPRDSSVAVFATSAVDPRALETLPITYPKEQDIYTTSIERVPSSERRLLITDTSVTFAALQNIYKQASERDYAILRDEDRDRRREINRLATDYVSFTRKCWVLTSTRARTEPLQFESDHYRTLYTCLSLFVVLYLMEDDSTDAPVGEDLMEWLNIHFIEPSSEEGNSLSSQERPWEDETFWPYLTRTVLRGLTKASVFFFDVLSRHPSEDLRDLAQRLSPLLASRPHLIQFSAEREFVIAHRRWKDKVKSLRLELDRVEEDMRHDGFENWWEQVSDIVGILEGRPEVIERICLDMGAEWKEIVAAWAVFVDNRLRRQSLPDVVGQIFEDVPFDPTNLEDVIHAALFSGQPEDALSHAARLDVWLAAHLADLMETVDLIDKKPDADSELSLRQQYILSYSEYLRSDPALWRITVDYMCTCGPIGMEQADQVLLRVPSLSQLNGKASASTSAEDLKARSDHVANILKEVVQTCSEHERDNVARMVCSIAAQTLLRQREYGLAISYMALAEDWTGLGRVVDSILTEYILRGPEVFVRSVAAVAPSLQSLRSNPSANGIFVHRLAFAVRYAEFHQRRSNGDLRNAALDLLAMFQEEVTPKSWWGVLICDAIELLESDGPMLFASSGLVELLKRLEEIEVRVAQGSSDDYLSVLVKTLKNGSVKEAMQRLKIARLFLVKYYAQCTMLDGAGHGMSGLYIDV